MVGGHQKCFLTKYIDNTALTTEKQEISLEKDNSLEQEEQRILFCSLHSNRGRLIQRCCWCPWLGPPEVLSSQHLSASLPVASLVNFGIRSPELLLLLSRKYFQSVLGRLVAVLCYAALGRFYRLLNKNQNHVSTSKNLLYCPQDTAQKLFSLSETSGVQQVCREAALDTSRYLRKKGDSFLKLGTTSRVWSCSFSHQESGCNTVSNYSSYWHVFQVTESLS